MADGSPSRPTDGSRELCIADFDRREARPIVELGASRHIESDEDAAHLLGWNATAGARPRRAEFFRYGMCDPV